jgi:hypothetical protein
MNLLKSKCIKSLIVQIPVWVWEPLNNWNNKKREKEILWKAENIE